MKCEVATETKPSTSRPATISATTTAQRTTDLSTTMNTTSERTTHSTTTKEPSTTLSYSTKATTSLAPCEHTNSCDGHYFCGSAGQKYCSPGYTGPECKDRSYLGLDDPECPSGFECRNGGTCWNKTCCCPAGFAGSYCQLDVLECLSQPCQNGGICKDEIAHYRCECVPGKKICGRHGGIFYRYFTSHIIVMCVCVCVCLTITDLQDSCTHCSCTVNMHLHQNARNTAVILQQAPCFY